MIAVLCLLVLAVAAAKAAGVEAAAHAHNVLAGFLAAGLVLLTAAPSAPLVCPPGPQAAPQPGAPHADPAAPGAAPGPGARDRV